jgi:hypothetical protein
VDARKRIHHTYRQYIRRKYEGHVLDTQVRTSTSLAKTYRNGETIFDHNPQARGARDYANATDELLVRMGMKAPPTDDADPPDAAPPADEAPSPDDASPDPEAATDDGAPSDGLFAQAKREDAPDATSADEASADETSADETSGADNAAAA